MTSAPVMEIEKEQAADAALIEALLDTGFGAGRLSKTVYRLRLGPPLPELSLVVRSSGLHLSGSFPDNKAGIAACIRFWPVEIRTEGRTGDEGTVPALLLGPLAVDPALRGRGLGRALITHSLEVADAAGWPLCLVVGEASYYRPYGFEPAAPLGLELPGPVDPERFQIRGMAAPGRISGHRIPGHGPDHGPDHGRITVHPAAASGSHPGSCAGSMDETGGGFRAA